MGEDVPPNFQGGGRPPSSPLYKPSLPVGSGQVYGGLRECLSLIPEIYWSSFSLISSSSFTIDEGRRFYILYDVKVSLQLGSNIGYFATGRLNKNEFDFTTIYSFSLKRFLKEYHETKWPITVKRTYNSYYSRVWSLSLSKVCNDISISKYVKNFIAVSVTHPFH